MLKVDPTDTEARSAALYGAWLCGTVLGTVGMGASSQDLPHARRSFNTPHAETHAIMLPHTVGFNAGAVPEQLQSIADLFEATPGAGLFDFSARIGAPLALKDLGLSETDLERAADIATENPYWNPRPIDRASIRHLLQDAWEGTRPAI